MSKNIFITRPLEPESALLTDLQALGFKITARALITQEPVEIPAILPKTSWTFFSSKHGVIHFFGQNPKTGKQKYGAIGRGTAGELKKHVPVDFSGDSNDTEITGKAFRKLIRTSKVLFPSAADSLRAIQKCLKPEQCIDLVCYRTIDRSESIGFPDILVFSSPSNVQSFARKNTFKDSQLVIAFGTSTARALRDTGRQDVVTLKGVTDTHIADAIKRVSVS